MHHLLSALRGQIAKEVAVLSLEGEYIASMGVSILVNEHNSCEMKIRHM